MTLSLNWMPLVGQRITTTKPDEFTEFMMQNFGRSGVWDVFDGDRKFLTKNKDKFPHEIRDIINALAAHPSGIVISLSIGDK